MMCVDKDMCSERMESLNKDILDLNSRIDKHDEKFEKLEAIQNNLKVEFAQMQSEIKVINTNTKDTKEDVKRILDKPAQYWDKVILAILSAVVGYGINLFFR